MDWDEWHARNHREFVEWCALGKARRMTAEEAQQVLATVHERVVRETLTREQVRKMLLDGGIWLSIAPEGPQEWTLNVQPIFTNLEGKLQRVRPSVAPPPL